MPESMSGGVEMLLWRFERGERGLNGRRVLVGEGEADMEAI